MKALKASWVVRVGVIPGEPIPERTRQWTLTSADLEGKTLAEGAEAFTSRRAEATTYAGESQDPLTANWVSLEFLWL